eukprot:NODE_3045_length_2102_cov_5.219747.p1 GENE.NODE_3045_length_2102_cov_5.219747~~NODE_3045_length_2102_cov_5.219747.p1  ORF type:complete len:510 (+),score=161.30 NODE_3045_length_2102_cov_5.219747:283-1812(+)
MAEHKKLQTLVHPRSLSQATPEAQSFKAFKVRGTLTEAAAITDVAFSPCAPHRLAVASGTKVVIWKLTKGGEIVQHTSLQRFKNLTQCVAWRSDGNLLLAGEASGSCAVIEMATRKVLRRFTGHGDAVSCASFATADKAVVATGCRDGRLRLWDIPSREQLRDIEAHTARITWVASCSGGADCWVTAGHDGVMKLWDLRADDPLVATAEHGKPIEAGTAFPGGSVFATVGGTGLKIWDLVAGGKFLHGLDKVHSKDITSVCLDPSSSVIMTASLDGLAHVHRASDLKHVCTHSLPGPATCVAWRPDDTALAIGLADGRCQVRERRRQDVPSAKDRAKLMAARLASRSFAEREGHKRGRTHTPMESDEVVTGHHKKRETTIDHHLRKFEYRKALEYMVTPSTQPMHGYAVVDELLQRGMFRSAMHEIGEDLCLKMLLWLTKAFGSGGSFERYLGLEALHTLFDGNACLQPPRTAQLLAAFSNLEHKLSMEMAMQRRLTETGGMLKMVMSL